MTTPSTTDADAALFGNRFITQEVPSREFPDGGMPAATRCGWWPRTWRSRATRPGTSPPS